MNTMIAEILACLVAAGALGLFCGWMIKAALTKRALAQAEEKFSKKYTALEVRTQQDIEHLEDQLQNMGDEVKTLTNSNRSLNESLRKNEVSVHKSRTDAIELNRQQAETQERLQRIILEKDEELNFLKNADASAELGKTATASGISAAVAARASDILNADNTDTDSAEITSKSDTLAAKREAWEREQQALMDTLSEEQHTVALDQNDISPEHLDKTVKLDNELLGRSYQNDDSFDDTLSLNDQTDRSSLGGKPKPDKDHH